MRVVCALLVAVGGSWAQFEDENKDYMGQYIGELNSYHHQVGGEVFAVDANTLLIRNFVYDGNAKDTFFWAGSSNAPGIKGFIIPDKSGKTNVLDKYYNEEFTLTLPSQKRITDIKWVAVYDITTQSNFGDVYIPSYFEPPIERPLAAMIGDHGINSTKVIVVDSKTIMLPAFAYDGKGGDVYFFAGEGPQPSSRGFIVPDELGYITPIGVYKDKKDVILQLPGSKTVFTIDWLAVYDLKNKRALAYVIVEQNLNVPPSLVTVTPHNPGLPNCLMLHKNLMVAWESFPPQLTIQIAGFIEDDEYMAFGLSGKQGENQMVGGDVALLYMDEFLGHVEDFNLTARSVCHKVLGQEKGACKDSLINNHQLASSVKENGVTALTYRTTFDNLADKGDIEIPQNGETSIIWAMGKISEVAHRIKEPSFHHTYSRTHTTLDFGRAERYDSCIPFTSDRKEVKTPWKIAPLFDSSKRRFNARLGPAGGRRGHSGRSGLPASTLVWYIDGRMAPEIYVRRELPITFEIEGGSDPRSEEYYHPFIITDEPVGGYNRLTEKQRRNVRVLAGVKFTRRGVAEGQAAGRLCKWTHSPDGDRRRDDEFKTFEQFRNSLQMKCEDGEPALLEVTPNATWPDIVYYNSLTTPYMGYKIHVVDSFRRRPSFSSSMVAYPAVALLFLLPVMLFSLG